MPPKFKEFINGTLNQVTMNAALQRSNTYEQNTSDRQRRDFREDLCSGLEKIAQNYKSPVSVDKHLINIQQLQGVSRKHRDILDGGRIRIGVAQKALNLYLKLLWSLGKIKEPPHCPLDSVIINKLPRACRRNWTEITTVRQYEILMKEVDKKAKEEGKSIAEWELKVFHE